MENQVGMETTLFGGPPEIGNIMKLANGQIGFMGIFAHPLFANVTDVIPAMAFAATEITNNKSVWMTRIEQEKRKQLLTNEGYNDGSVSPRSQSPAPRKLDKLHTGLSPSIGYFPTSPFRHASNPPSPLQLQPKDPCDPSLISMSQVMTADVSPRNQTDTPSWRSPFVANGQRPVSSIVFASQEVPPTSSGVFPNSKFQFEAQKPDVHTRRSSNIVAHSLQVNGDSEPYDQSTTSTTSSSEHGGDIERRKSEISKSDYTIGSVPSMDDDSVPNLPNQPQSAKQERLSMDKSSIPEQFVSISRHSPVSNRPIVQVQHQTYDSSQIAVSSTANSKGITTSQGQIYYANLPTTLSPSAEAGSSVSAKSNDEQFEDRENGLWHTRVRVEQQRDRSKDSPKFLPGAVTSNMLGHDTATVSDGGADPKNSVKTSTSVVQEPGQETASASEDGDGDKSIRRRMSRFRFWRKKTDDDDR